MKSKPIAADIAKAARAKTDPVAVETVHLFTGWLGSVAGNLALSFGGRGGVYIAGGIVPRWGELFDASCSAIASKPRAACAISCTRFRATSSPPKT